MPISEATRRRMLAAAARLDYRPNLLARGLRTQRSGTIEEVLAYHRHVVAIARAHGHGDPVRQRGRRGGVRLALDHLCALGQRHIGLVGNRLGYGTPYRRGRSAAGRPARPVPAQCTCPSWSSGGLPGWCAPL